MGSGRARMVGGDKEDRTVVGAPETRYAKSGDLSIACSAYGDGPDLVVAPGFISHLEVALEEPALAHFYDRLATFRRVILFDKRGTGLSDPVPHAPTLEENVEDLRAVMDAVGSERADVVGVSEGGAMAALFAAVHPKRTRSLVLYGTYSRVLWAPDYPCGVSAESHGQLLEMVDARWGDGVGLSAWAPSCADDARMRTWWARLQRTAASPGMVHSLLALYPQIDIRAVLGTIGVPTLVLHRRDDRMINVEMGRYLAAHIPGAKLIEFDGADHLFWVGNADAILDEIEEFLTGLRRGPEPDRVLATVLFTDLVGSTEHAIELGDTRWRYLLESHQAQVRRQLERFRGREVKTMGDGFLATFDGPARAIRCAQAVVDQSRGLGLETRAGLHTGECELMNDDVGGIAVHIPARVATLAEAREVLVSSTVKDLVAGSGLTFVDRGVHALKGLPDEWRLFAVAG
jgi:pimeloyl-ACP methyl ester carboxylesterase